MTLIDYKKMCTIQADLKLQDELNKPDRVLQEEQFAKEHRKDTDEELIEYVARMKLKMGKSSFNRYNMIGYNYLVERFGSWCSMITRVNLRIKEIRAKELKK